MLKIELIRQLDGAVILHCMREDGSITWQKQTRHAAHFALHDLTHYAVETTLSSRQGFFSLLAEGWDIDDTTGKGSRGPLPPETIEIEQIVGLFDTERGSGVLWTADEFNQFSPRHLSSDEIQRIRSLRSSLFGRWRAVVPGDKMELTFFYVERSRRT